MELSSPSLASSVVCWLISVLNEAFSQNNAMTVRAPAALTSSSDSLIPKLDSEAGSMADDWKHIVSETMLVPNLSGSEQDDVSLKVLYPMCNLTQ